VRVLARALIRLLRSWWRPLRRLFTTLVRLGAKPISLVSNSLVTLWRSSLRVARLALGKLSHYVRVVTRAVTIVACAFRNLGWRVVSLIGRFLKMSWMLIIVGFLATITTLTRPVSAAAKPLLTLLRRMWLGVVKYRRRMVVSAHNFRIRLSQTRRETIGQLRQQLGLKPKGPLTGNQTDISSSTDDVT